MSSLPSSILVLGAGELGKAVLNHLAEHSFRDVSKTSITLFLRETTISTTNPEKRAELAKLEEQGIQFLAGDLNHDSESSLSGKFAPYDYVICCAGMGNPPGTQLSITRAALAAGVKHYIPWQFGVDYDLIGKGSHQSLFTEQLEVRELLRSQAATSWIILSTGMFMSFLFEDSFGVVSNDKKTVRALGSWANCATVTDVEDIGKMVAEIVFDPREIGSEVVYISGETVSYGDLADLVDEINNSQQPRREEWTVEYLKGQLQNDPDHSMLKYRAVFAEGVGVAWDVEETLNVQRGIRLKSVRDYVRCS